MLGLGSSINLVDQADSESVAHLDKRADYRHGIALLGPDFAQVFGQSIQLVYPSGMPVNRALWVVLALWRDRDGEFPRQKIIASDLKQLTDTQVVLGELVIPAPPASPSAGAALAHFEQRLHARHSLSARNSSRWRYPEHPRSPGAARRPAVRTTSSFSTWATPRPANGSSTISSRSARACPPVCGTVDSPIAKSGACRCPPTWRPAATTSSPGCIARVTASEFR